MKELKYELEGNNLVANGLIVMGLDTGRITVSLGWLERAGFKGKFTVYRGIFGSEEVYTTKIKGVKKTK